VKGETLAIEVNGLRMRYGAHDVLEDVTLQVRVGEVVVLLGPNGAGKTTTIEILEGFRIRSAGHVVVLGTDPAVAGERWRARVGIVLQSWRDHGKWRVREFLAHLGSYYVGYSDGDVNRPRETDELISAVGLHEQANQEIRTLSGGQRRRLDVAVGIVGRPDVLFLDEPTVGFDPESRREFHALIESLAVGGRTTILLTTHDLAEAEKLAQRIVILDGGRIVADGTKSDLSRRIAGRDVVGWTLAGRRFTEATADSTRFAMELFRRHGEEISELEVRRASLEDTYLAIVQQAELGSTAQSTDAQGGAS
jgi:ABC-2 type transport system ATP-binding protein